MKKHLTSDTAMKVYSVLIAFLLWGFVVYNQNPPQSKAVHAINVFYTNLDALEQVGLTVVQDPNLRASVTVRGKRLSVAKVDSTNVIASVTVPEIKAGTYTVPIDIKLPISDVSLADKRPYTVKLVVEPLETKTFPITVTVNGEDDKHTFQTTASADTLTLSGARSVLNSVASVRAVVNKSDAGKTVNAALILTDVNGRDITDNLNLKKSVSNISVTVYSLTSTLTPVEAVLEGSCAEGFAVTKITCEPASVLLGAKQETLAPIAVLKTEPVSIQDGAEALRTKAKLEVPDGYTLLGDTDTVTVTVEIEAVTDKSVTIGAGDITLTNADAKKTYTLDAPTYTFTVHGAQSLLAQDIHIEASADVSGLADGTHTVSVRLTLPEGIAADAPEVHVTVQ